MEKWIELTNRQRVNGKGIEVLKWSERFVFDWWNDNEIKQNKRGMNESNSIHRTKGANRPRQANNNTNQMMRPLLHLMVCWRSGCAGFLLGGLWAGHRPMLRTNERRAASNTPTLSISFTFFFFPRELFFFHPFNEAKRRAAFIELDWKNNLIYLYCWVMGQRPSPQMNSIQEKPTQLLFHFIIFGWVE